MAAAVVEQILLGDAGVRAERFGADAGQKRVHRAAHPDVDGKRVEAVQAVEEDALGHLRPDAVDFLHKPFSYERFEVAVEKALRRISARRPSVPESLVVKQEYNNVSIPLDDILYIEALGNYVKIVRASGSHVLTRTNLKAITDLLPAGRFLRIHRSYVVAVTAVVSFTRSRVVLKGHDKGFPVGAQYASQVVDALGK